MKYLLLLFLCSDFGLRWYSLEQGSCRYVFGHPITVPPGCFHLYSPFGNFNGDDI